MIKCFVLSSFETIKSSVSVFSLSNNHFNWVSQSDLFQGKSERSIALKAVPENQTVSLHRLKEKFNKQIFILRFLDKQVCKRARWFLCYPTRVAGETKSSSPPSEETSTMSTPSPTDHGFILPDSLINGLPSGLAVTLLAKGKFEKKLKMFHAIFWLKRRGVIKKL